MAAVNLRRCRIVADTQRPGWVDQAALDLARFTDGTIEGRLGQSKGAIVLVGKQVVRAAAEQNTQLREVGLDGLSDQGFVLATVQCRNVSFVICSGGGSRGDAYAVIELIRSAEAKAEGCFIDETCRREEPRFIRRGIYAHQHWAYSYPYALRSWKFEDWRGYIDLLAHLKVNLFQIWSMAGILPVPLSDGDREYLENYRRVIDYARNRRGMEVYIGECANNVAGHDAGRPVAEREYFDVEALKNPADPREFQEIMANRRGLYSVASNADGYWVIDSDPGGYEGSSVSEFADILTGNRELIDQLTDAGRNSKLVYWMWQGWGKGIPVAERLCRCREAVEQMRDRLKEPWMLLTCNEVHLAQAAELGLLHKSIFFPYGWLESEPSEPMTRIRFREIYDQLNGAISNWGIRNVMGNAQTPFVQMPNLFFLTETAWNGLEPSRPAERPLLEKLARLMAPDAAAKLADGWLALMNGDPDVASSCAERLSEIADSARPGSLGLFYGPGVNRLISDLALQLAFHGGAGSLVKALESGPHGPRVEAAFEDFARAWSAWQSRHGYTRASCYAPEFARVASYTPGGTELRKKLLDIGVSESAADVFVARLEGEAKG